MSGFSMRYGRAWRPEVLRWFQAQDNKAALVRRLLEEEYDRLAGTSGSAAEQGVPAALERRLNDMERRILEALRDGVGTTAPRDDTMLDRGREILDALEGLI